MQEGKRIDRLPMNWIHAFQIPLSFLKVGQGSGGRTSPSSSAINEKLKKEKDEEKGNRMIGGVSVAEELDRGSFSILLFFFNYFFKFMYSLNNY